MKENLEKEEMVASTEHTMQSRCFKKTKCQVCNYLRPSSRYMVISTRRRNKEEEQGGSNLNINFAEMDLKSASATSLHQMSLVDVH